MKKNNFIEGTFIATASIILIKILGMLYVIPFYKIVGPQGGALYTYAYNIYLIFLSISSAGIPSAISKIISEYNALGMDDAKTRAYKLAKKFIMYFSLAAFVTLFLFAEEIGRLILGDLKGGNTVQDVALVIRCVSFAVLIIPHLSVTKGYLQGHNYISAPSNANLIEQVVRIFIILVGSYLVYKVFNGSLSLAVGTAMLGAFLGGLVAYWYLKVKISKSDEVLTLNKKAQADDVSNKAIIKKIATYALPFIIIALVSNIYSVADMVLSLRTLDYLGFKDAEFITSVISTWGSKICMIVNSIAMGMTMTLIPNIVEAFATNNWQDLSHKINKALQIIIYVSVPLTLGLSVLAVPVWTVFYNTNAYGGAILKVMIFNALAGNIYSVVEIILQSVNNYKAVYKSSIWGFICKAIIHVPLMLLFHKFGLEAFYGAILATTISYSVSVYIGLRALRKGQQLKYRETAEQIFKMLVPSLAMVLVLVLLNQFLPFSVYKRLPAMLLIGINAVIGGLIYLGFSWKLKIPQTLFGEKELNRLIKKLTFGKFGR